MILLFQEKSSDWKLGKGIKKIPAVEVSPLRFSIPQKKFDYVLVTSIHSLEKSKLWPRAKTYVAIGKKTARGLKKCPYPVQVLSDSHSAGLIQFFKRQPPSSIFFPRSKRGDPATPKLLRKMGHRVLVRHAYKTQIRSLKNYRAQIFSARVQVLFFASPSCFKALTASFSKTELQALSVEWVAIGPTTAKAMRKYLGKSPRVTDEPSPSGLRKALFDISNKRH